MLWNTLFSQRLISLYLYCPRSFTVRSSASILNQIKTFNERKQYRKVLETFDHYQKHNHSHASGPVIVEVLKACIQLQDLRLGSKIYLTFPSSLKSNPYVFSSLLSLYIRCGEMKKAGELFDQFPHPSIQSYAIMMKGYIEHKQASKAIDLYRRIRNPDDIIFVLSLKACAQDGSPNALNLVKSLSSKGMNSKTKNNPRVITSLIDAFAKCGDISSAEVIFHGVASKYVEMYGAMMKGYINHGQAEKAIDLFDQTPNPDDVTLLLLLNACAEDGSPRALDKAKQVLPKVLESEAKKNARVITSLIDALMKCGDLVTAENVFRDFASKSVEMYGAMMKGYIVNNQPTRAIDLFNQIRAPTDIILILLLQACAEDRSPRVLDVLKQVSSKIMNSKTKNNPRVITSLIDASMACGDVSDAEAIFHGVAPKFVEMYGAMMKGYINHGQAEKAIDLFDQTPNPDDVTLLLLLNACAEDGSPRALDKAKQVLPKVLESEAKKNARVITSLIDALMKCGDLVTAENVFRDFASKPVEMYGAMMKGYVKNNQATKAIDLFHQIEDPDDQILTFLFNACAQAGTSDALSLAKSLSSTIITSSSKDNHVVMASLLDAFIKLGDMDSALMVFKTMTKSRISYANLMSGLNKDEQPDQVLRLYNQMKKDSIEIDEVIYLCLIKALALTGNAELAKKMITEIPTRFLDSLYIRHALIDMWGKVGMLPLAEEIFEQISEPNMIAYGAMINGYGLNGKAGKAVTLFYRVPSTLLNERIYISVLNACSHAGFVDQARHIFQTIPTKTDRIYTTLVDCLSRASLFDEAQQVIAEFEQNHSPSCVMYMALLSGARTRNHSQLAHEIVSRMKMLFPNLRQELMAASILLSNIYGSLGETDKVMGIRNELNRSLMKKKIGVSWTSVDGELSVFRAHDRSHPRSAEIYEELERISTELVRYGHQYDSSWITRSLNEDETVESALCGHSERLAIAWNFVAKPDTKQIQLTKNLRVCGDCHQATKLIALIRQCEIVVRDANRFHHFSRDGRCSCGDYF